MNGVLGHLCGHIGWTGRREPPEDGEMIAMTLAPPDTGFEIRTPAVWGQVRYLSVTEVPHNIESLWVSGEETFCFFETCRSEWGSNPRSPTFQAGSFNHCTRAAAFKWVKNRNKQFINIKLIFFASPPRVCWLPSCTAWDADPALF